MDSQTRERMVKAMELVAAERERQDEKWGEQNHAWPQWLTILMEEIGEFSHDVLEGEMSNAMTELVQVTAVALAMIECGLRNKRGKPRS